MLAPTRPHVAPGHPGVFLWVGGNHWVVLLASGSPEATPRPPQHLLDTSRDDQVDRGADAGKGRHQRPTTRNGRKSEKSRKT